jgi:hypothetical protein
MAGDGWGFETTVIHAGAPGRDLDAGCRATKG